MKRIRARLLIGLAAVLAALGLALGPASAATWTVSPANTDFTLTPVGPITLSGGSAKITCNGGSGTGNSGGGANPLFSFGPVTLTNCTDNILGGTWTVTISGGDLAGTSYDASTGVTTGTITGGTVTASGSDLGISCSFTATGTLDGTYTNSTGILSVTGGTATISNVSGSGCSLGGISNGSTGTLSGSFEVSPAMTITAS